jgi:hypothetical protein
MYYDGIKVIKCNLQSDPAVLKFPGKVEYAGKRLIESQESLEIIILG